MPLSKHFYSLDEVQAALFYTAGRYDAKEAAFWCQELIDSGCIGEAISTLFESWLWHKGPFCLSWLLQAWSTLRSEELSEEAILLAVYQLCSVRKKDHSLWNVLALSGQEVDRVTPKTQSSKDPVIPKTQSSKDPVIPKTQSSQSLKTNNKENYFLRAVCQGKARSAWWISCYMSSDRVWQLLECISPLAALKGYEDLLGYRSDEYDMIIRCCAILAACLSPLQQEESYKPLPTTMDKHLQDALTEWRLLNGRMARRVYVIPTACLYGKTQRGNKKWSQSNLVQLYQVEPYMIGCPFWDNALLAYASINEEGKIQWKSDADRSAFYQAYFPDDIPDEWSLAEKKKSHGDGVLGPTEQVLLAKYARTHFASLSRLAWGTTKAVQLYLEKQVQNKNECDISTIVHQHIFPFDEALLEPVHKRLRIING